MATGDAWRPGASTRRVLLAALVLQVSVVGFTAAALFMDGRGLPRWFIGAFIAGLAALVPTLCWYMTACWRGELAEPVALDGVAAATLLLVVASFVCTSSLHHFYPFRPSLPQRLEGVPLGLLPPRPMLRMNYAFTAAALAAGTTLAMTYALGRRRAAIAGMALLAVVLLLPNDNCDNAFNRPWLRLIGASPLMFAPASMGLVVAACGLCQLWRRTSLLLLLGICLGTLSLGLGHITRFIW